MPATLAELLTALTETEAEETILGILEAVGFPATAWQRFGWARTTVKLIARLYVDSKTGITNIVKSRLLDLATGDALTYIAEHFYRVIRDDAVPAEGEFLLTDDGGAPYTIEVGQLLVQETSTGLRFRNTTGGTLAAGDTLALTFKAEEPGADYNIETDADLEFAETLEGVLVTNPAVAGSDTWITTTGTDEQSDTSLREECRNKWATVGAGNADAYKAWAREGSSALTKVIVLDDEPDGPGTVRVIVATDDGEAGADDVTAADEVIQAKRPVGLRAVTVVAASAVTVTINATVNVFSGASTYLTTLATNRDAMQAEIMPGDEVYLSRIDALLHSPGNVRNAVITLPVGTTGVDFDQIAVLTLGTITVNTVSR